MTTDRSILHDLVEELPEVDDDAVERWLRDEVTDVYDVTVADPSRSVSMESVRVRLAAQRTSDR